LLFNSFPEKLSNSFVPVPRSEPLSIYFASSCILPPSKQPSTASTPFQSPIHQIQAAAFPFCWCIRQEAKQQQPSSLLSLFFSPSSKHSLPATNPFSPKSVSGYELQILSHSPPPAISPLLLSPIEGRKQQSTAVLPSPSADPSISSELL
jgi:hypothetical protein